MCHAKSRLLSAFQKLEEKNYKIDICINNAGIALYTPIFEPDEQRLL